MVKAKHKGPRAKSRHITKKGKRDKGMPTVNKMLQVFEVGEKVHVQINPSIHSAMPHRRFIGKTGEIKGKQGNCYIVEVRDMNAVKNIILHPAHLTPVKKQASVKPVAKKVVKKAIASGQVVKNKAVTKPVVKDELVVKTSLS